MTLERTRFQTKSDAAYTSLREAILAGQLAPGSRVTLQALADDLGMSLTPVREALRLLDAQGLVTHDAHRGTRVASLTRRGIEDVYQLRRVLEPLACELAAVHATEEDLNEIDATLVEFDRAAADGRSEDLPRLNAALHRRIYQAADSKYLLEFTDRLWGRIPHQAMSVVHHHARSSREHQAIVAAVRAHKAKTAGRLMREHITKSTQATLARFDRLIDVVPDDQT